MYFDLRNFYQIWLRKSSDELRSIGSASIAHHKEENNFFWLLSNEKYNLYGVLAGQTNSWPQSPDSE
jgi:hypothetical protein